MRNRTLEIIGRLLKVLAYTTFVVGGVHFGARVAGLVLPTYPYSFDDKTIWNYWDYVSEDPITVIMSHLMGAAIAGVSALAVYGLFCLARYVVNGPRQYVDPCRDNRRCPCPRHRQEERDERTAAVAAATATGIAIGTVIN